MDLDALRELADGWVRAGESARRQRRDDVASALIGCAQALRALLDPPGDPE